MNKARRKRITSVIGTLGNITGYDLIETAKDEIEDILWEEEDVYENMPENLQYSMRGEESSDAIDSLQEAVDALENAIELLEEIDNMDDDDSDDDDDDKEMREADIELKESEIDDYIYQAINALEEII